MRSLLFNAGALAALVPAALVHLRGRDRPDAVFWALLGVAVAGSTAWSVAQLSGDWRTGFSVALWVTISASLAVFVLVAVIAPHAWRLTPVLLPYLLILGLLASVWGQAPARPIPAATPETWLTAHIAVSVLTYALLTIAAIASVTVILRERTLKLKRAGGLVRALPSVADAEDLEIRLLVAGEIVLGAGVVTGMATQYLAEGTLISFEHKTLLSLLAFAVIGLLLLAHWRTGVRGRRAARYVLAAYLLLTLAYPGVKFVTDVLLA